MSLERIRRGPIPVIGGDCTETEEIKVALQEGGNWLHLTIHSLVMPDGSRWDAHNGWTSGPAQGSGWTGLPLGDHAPE